MANNYKRGRTCSTCTGPISDHNKSGVCKPCIIDRINSDPAIAERRDQGIRRALLDPVVRARHAANLAKGRAARDPEKLKASALRMRLRQTPESEARRIAAIKAKAGKSRHAWLPDEYYPLYLKMLKSNGYTAPEAKAIILQSIADEKRRAEAKLSPFERQELALKRGAKLVANDTAPSLTNPANYGEERWSYGR